MSECSHQCDSCSENCPSREKKSFLAELNGMSSVQKVIGVVSGKGGVGKSIVTALLASAMARKGYRTAVLDADVTGPSIPRAFGIHEHATSDGTSLYPVKSRGGVEVMSVNLLLEHETDPVVWRGPVIANTVKQFWTDVVWQNIDYMFVNMPPGTGDVPLTVFQSLPLDGILMVTTPQELVGMIVGKAVKMANMMNVPILGVVENMSYAVCPDCGKRFSVFGESRLEQTAAEFGVPVLGRLPMSAEFAAACDRGEVETLSAADLQEAVAAVEALGQKQ